MTEFKPLSAEDLAEFAALEFDHYPFGWTVEESNGEWYWKGPAGVFYIHLGAVPNLAHILDTLGKYSGRLLATIKELKHRSTDNGALETVAAMIYQNGGEVRVTERSLVSLPRDAEVLSWTDIVTGDKVFRLLRPEKPGDYHQLTPEEVMAELEGRAAAPSQGREEERP